MYNLMNKFIVGALKNMYNVSLCLWLQGYIKRLTNYVGVYK